MFKHCVQHFKNYVLRGILAIIPIAISIIAIRFLYIAIDKQAMGLVDELIGFRVPGLGILILLVSLYIIGVVASNVIGRQFFGILEKVSSNIPIIKTTYLIGKQLVATLSLPEKQVFKRVVLVDYLKPGIWTIGFVTGSVIDRERNDEVLLKAYDENHDDRIVLEVLQPGYTYNDIVLRTAKVKVNKKEDA